MRNQKKISEIFRFLLLNAVVLLAAGWIMLVPTTAYAAHGHSNGHGHHHSNQSGQVPEVPYSFILPVGLIGMTYWIYRRKTKSA